MDNASKAGTGLTPHYHVLLCETYLAYLKTNVLAKNTSYNHILICIAYSDVRYIFLIYIEIYLFFYQPPPPKKKKRH